MTARIETIWRIVIVHRSGAEPKWPTRHYGTYDELTPKLNRLNGYLHKQGKSDLYLAVREAIAETRLPERANVYDGIGRCRYNNIALSEAKRLVGLNDEWTYTEVK